MEIVIGFLPYAKWWKLKIISRVIDGLPLVEGLDDGCDQKDVEFYKEQVKVLF